MAQGTRGRWVRAAAAGLGVVLSTGLIGCMNTDKPKDSKAAAGPAKAGLPGTPTLPAGGAAAGTGTNPGGLAQAKWTQPGTNTPYKGPGSNLQNSGFASGVPAGNNGLTTTAGPGQTYGNWPPGPNPGTINTPALPGAQPSVLPAGGVGGPIGAAPVAPAGVPVASGYAPSSSPPPPDLLGGPLPPPAPPHPSVGNEIAGGPVLPPGLPGAGPIAPPVSPALPIAPSKGGY